jgi:hypothetical protein
VLEVQIVPGSALDTVAMAGQTPKGDFGFCSRPAAANPSFFDPIRMSIRNQ